MADITWSDKTTGQAVTAAEFTEIKTAVNTKLNANVITAISSNTSAGSTARTHYIYLISNGATLTLPTAVGNTGKYTVRNTGTVSAFVATTSSQQVNGDTNTNTIPAGNSVDLISDGSNWWQI